MKNKIQQLKAIPRRLWHKLNSKLTSHDPPKKHIRLTYTGKI